MRRNESLVSVASEPMCTLISLMCLVPAGGHIVSDGDRTDRLPLVKQLYLSSFSFSFFLIAAASNLIPMASNLIAMASNLVAAASNLVAVASNLIAVASNLIAAASNLVAVASNQIAAASNLVAVASNLIAATPT